MAKLVEGAMPAGVRLFEVNRAGGVQGLSSGVYFARMSVAANGSEIVRTARAIVLR